MTSTKASCGNPEKSRTEWAGHQELSGQGAWGGAGNATGIAMEEKRSVKGPVKKLNHPKAGSQKASGPEQRDWV
jgi:hypothetical protein